MIMHIITNFGDIGGAETMLTRLLRASPEKAFVVSLKDVSERNQKLAGDHVKCVALGMNSWTRYAGAGVRLARLIGREKPEVIVCWMYHAMVAGIIAGRLARTEALIYWNVRQSLDDVNVLSRSSRIAAKISSVLSRLPDGIIYNSQRAMELHRRFGFENNNIEVIPNGFPPVDSVRDYTRRPRIYGIAGRFHPQKDHALFFKAAAQLAAQEDDVRFIAVGRGLNWENETVRTMISDAGLEENAIELRGETEDMESFYRSIDVLVLSSRTEGFPNVIAEAMGHGIPVVATDVGEAAVIVGDTGRIVPAGDAFALCNAMKMMYHVPAREFSELSKAARQRIDDNYSLVKICKRYRRFLKCT
ncbi:glycosyltransferase [Rhizobiales bacterium]|uniref:glycosyltransferase n=1 Tax=Hongsoonwoonella zoysiae TaxID=2821844 RepID=UPI0015606DBB|nr:glycosyltransferase [Hongsoonwoonella zoysiae]NRG18279.1 glycosyltransferase [Hongsoonwoonella zoysiae]